MYLDMTADHFVPDLDILKYTFDKNPDLGGVYEVPCHLHRFFKNVHYEPNDVKVAHKFCPRHICPQITSGTTESDVAKITAAVEKYVE